MGTITPAELHAALACIGWSGRELARRAGVADGTVRNWASGRYPVPPNLAMGLTALAAECAEITAQIEALNADRAALWDGRPMEKTNSDPQLDWIAGSER